MANSLDALGGGPCTVAGIRAIDESGEGLVEVEITVSCGRASLRTDRPGEHPWFGQFRHRLRLVWGRGQMGSDPDGRIRIEVPRGQLEDFGRAVRQAARDTDAEYQALLARRREHDMRESRSQRERQADPAKRARLADDQAHIDAVLAETEQ